MYNVVLQWTLEAQPTYVYSMQEDLTNVHILFYCICMNCTDDQDT
jgi:hypothetical protein